MVVAVATMTAEQPAQIVTAKSRLKAWIREKIEGEAVLRAPDVATLALEELSEDQDFMADLGRETLRSRVYELTLDVIAEGRGLRGEISAAPASQSVIAPAVSTDTRSQLQRRLAFLKRRYNSWWEHVEGKGHVALLSMDAADLQLAENERCNRIASEMRYAKFLRALRQSLKKGQTVGDRFPDLEALDLIRTACFEDKKTKQDGN